MCEEWEIENVDFFEVWRHGDTVSIKFMDLFDDGVEYMLPVPDAEFLRDALTKILVEGE